MKKIVKIIAVVCTFVLLFSSCAKETVNTIAFQDHPIDRENFKSIAVDPGIEKEERFTLSSELTSEELCAALDYIVLKIDENLADFTYKFPKEFADNLIYPPTDNIGWTEGFWTGMLWLAYEYTGDVKYKNVAALQCGNFRNRIENNVGLEHHDLGFLYYPSCVRGYELTGDETMRETALMAADKLITRYHEKGKFIQAWGEYGDEAESRLIIDTLMNLELLYWASSETGDGKYFEVASEHAKTTTAVIMREDSSTHHTFYINPETGNPSHGVTDQGLNDDTPWSRGQAWGVYGFNISYRYTGDSIFMEEGTKTSNYFLNNLPKDLVAYWDLSFTDGDEPRDTSAAAIAASGFVDNFLYYDNQYRETYRAAANAIVRSLWENYTTKGMNSNAILTHGVYAYHHNLGIDDALLWGDYYYMEALVKLLRIAKS